MSPPETLRLGDLEAVLIPDPLHPAGVVVGVLFNDARGHEVTAALTTDQARLLADQLKLAACHAEDRAWRLERERTGAPTSTA